MKNVHVALPGSSRKALPGAVALGPENPHTVIQVTVKLRRKAALPPLQDRPSHVLTRQELSDKYGASKDDISAVVSAFAPLGIKAVANSPAARTVVFSGPIAAMEQAFQVKLLRYSHEGAPYRGRVGSIGVPSALQGIVQGVFGLDTRRVARRRRHPVSDAALARLVAIPAAWYTPAQLAQRYNFPAGDGGGQTVGLLEFGGGYFPSDLAQFCKLADISTPPKVTAISTDGTRTDVKDGDEGEVMLDIEVIAGVAPKANIAVYFAQWTEQGWLAALDAAVHDQANNPGVLSVSWGNAEDTDIWTEQAMTQVNETLQDAGQIGVTVCIAAGDDGSSDAVTDGAAHVDFPSSSPYVLAVGGTTIPAKGAPLPDVGWKEGDGLRADNGGSTGGGVSAVFPRPAWQSAIEISSVNPGAIEGRCIPDLAANADWDASPYLLVVDGKSQPNGGTSAASPLVASLLTLINASRPTGSRVGYLTPVLYQTSASTGAPVGAAACTDVTSGDNTTAHNGGYTAGPGYDCVSGWGTPNGVKLQQLIPVP